MRSVSITRRLTLTVLTLEFLAAITVIGAITVHERHTQLKAFDATLQGTANSLMGAVQDAEDEADNVILDTRSVQLGKGAVLLVEDKKGRILSSLGGIVPEIGTLPGVPSTFDNAKVQDIRYRFIVLHGSRFIDPGQPNGGVRHDVTITYGLPVGHVWHEVFEAVRLLVIATALLLGLTAAAMVWLLRRSLSPLHALAQEAERVTSRDWQFQAPASAKETTELQPLAHAIEAALARLKRSFEQQKRFTNDAAHELKTDLAIVKSSLQLLSMRKRTEEEYARGLTLSLDDFTRLESTVQKMLTLARLEQQAETTHKACSLQDVIEDVIMQSSSFAQLREVKIETEFGQDVDIPIDRRDALLLFSNVLLNALQHSPVRSSVVIEMMVEGGTVRLRVIDKGDGFAEEELRHVFEPFYRGDPSRSRKSGGTGLGLSICKAICERAGGSIEVSNGESGGAMVAITLPEDNFAPVSGLSVSIKH
jgi:two-component system OmpR family sensor kinase